MGMRRYDHRLIEHVQSTGDVGVALRAGIPRSTAHGWRHQRPVEVEGAGLFQEDIAALETRVSLMERRVRRLRALLRLAFALLHVVRPNLSRARVSADNKLRLLGAVDRSRVPERPRLADFREAPGWLLRRPAQHAHPARRLRRAYAG